MRTKSIGSINRAAFLIADIQNQFAAIEVMQAARLAAF